MTAAEFLVNGSMRNLFFALLATLCLIYSCQPAPEYVSISGYTQGGTYSVILNIAGSKATRDEIQTAVDSILLEIDNTLSGYNKSSMLSKFNQGQKIEENDLWREMMERAKAYREETDGALDCFSAPIFDVWGFGFSGDDAPDAAAVREAVEATRKSNRVNFNAIAQGYSCDLVAGYLHSIGVTDMLVNIGEIYCEGRNPARRNWSIGVDNPKDGNNIPGADIKAVLVTDGKPQGIVTSGNYRKFYLKNGKKYAHTLDPRTGYPVEHNLLSATIIAPTAIDADAYATYCMVVGVEESESFILGREDIEGYLIYSEDGVTMSWHSPGFNLVTEN